jgi:hypothetical protein
MCLNHKCCTSTIVNNCFVLYFKLYSLVLNQACFGKISCLCFQQMYSFVIEFSSLQSDWLFCKIFFTFSFKLPHNYYSLSIWIVCSLKLFSVPCGLHEVVSENWWQQNISHECLCVCIYVYIVAYRPVAKWWICKQQPLLGNTRIIHSCNNRTMGLCNPFLSNGCVNTFL